MASTLFKEQDIEDPIFWGTIYEGTKGDNFHNALRLLTNELFLDLCIANSDAARLMCQGRAMAIRSMLDLPDRAMEETRKLLMRNNPQEEGQPEPEANQ